MSTRLKPNRRLFAVSSLALLLASSAHAELRVVATLADFGALASEIGGDHAEVAVLAKPTEDEHFVDARPSFVVNLRNADVLIEGGAELESGWLPSLLRSAGNENIAVGAPGRVVASQGVSLLNVPAELTRAAGDVHALGNPHYMVDPIIAKTVARHIATSFAACDAANAATYDANYLKFETTVDARLQQWGKTMAPFQGANVVAFHDSWPYLARRFGITIDTFLEPKPGIPPSPAHLVEVIARMKARNSRAILVEPFQNRRTAEKVAAATGAVVVEAARYPGALPNTDTYVALIDDLVTRLAASLGGH